MESAGKIPESENFLRSSNVDIDNYNHDIQLYKIDAEGIISLEDLKKLGAARLFILRNVEAIANEERELHACLEKLVTRLRQRGFDSFADLFDGGVGNGDEEERRWARWRDHISHNAASLALSQNRETKWWLQSTEERLLEWRLTALNDQEITAFMEINDIRYPKLDEDEKKRLKYELIATIEIPEKFTETIFYKIPFLEAIALLKNHRVHLASGFAYPTTSQLRSVISHHHERHLAMLLKELEEKHSTTDDPRVRDLTDCLQKVHSSTKAIAWRSEIIREEDLDEIAAESHPPCMRKLHEALRRNNHLRHEGRVQYTLFLKSIGVSAESAIELFRNEFTRKITVDAFEKEYAYYIKHLYGIVGAKRNYEIFNCSKIARTSVANGEYHGCPFALGDIEDLDKMLDRWNISEDPKAKIVQLTMDRKFCGACSAYFEATHGRRTKFPIVNPMNYFRESRKIRDAGHEIPTTDGSENDDETEESDASSAEDVDGTENFMDIDVAPDEPFDSEESGGIVARKQSEKSRRGSRSGSDSD